MKWIIQDRSQLLATVERPGKFMLPRSVLFDARAVYNLTERKWEKRDSNRTPDDAYVAWSDQELVEAERVISSGGFLTLAYENKTTGFYAGIRPDMPLQKPRTIYELVTASHFKATRVDGELCDPTATTIYDAEDGKSIIRFRGWYGLPNLRFARNEEAQMVEPGLFQARDLDGIIRVLEFFELKPME